MSLLGKMMALNAGRTTDFAAANSTLSAYTARTEEATVLIVYIYHQRRWDIHNKRGGISL